MSQVKYLKEVTPYFLKATLLSSIGWDASDTFLIPGIQLGKYFLENRKNIFPSRFQPCSSSLSKGWLPEHSFAFLSSLQAMCDGGGSCAMFWNIFPGPEVIVCVPSRVTRGGRRLGRQHHGSHQVRGMKNIIGQFGQNILKYQGDNERGSSVGWQEPGVWSVEAWLGQDTTPGQCHIPLQWLQLWQRDQQWGRVDTGIARTHWLPSALVGECSCYSADVESSYQVRSVINNILLTSIIDHWGWSRPDWSTIGLLFTRQSSTAFV